MPITVLLGCDRHEARRSISGHLASCTSSATEPAIDCHAVPACDVLSVVALLHPDVLIMDRAAAGALFTAAQVRQISARSRVLLMCDIPTVEIAVEAVRRGARGFIGLSSEPALIARAVRSVHAGASWFGNALMFDALRGLLSPAGAGQPGAGGKLTQREEQVMDLIGTGLSNREIGRRLEISDHTVKTHLHRIYVKLNRSGRRDKAFPSHSNAMPDFAPADLGWATLQKLTAERC